MTYERFKELVTTAAQLTNETANYWGEGTKPRVFDTIFCHLIQNENYEDDEFFLKYGYPVSSGLHYNMGLGMAPTRDGGLNE